MTGTGVSDWTTEQGVTCVVCPDCAFTFDASHIDDRPFGRSPGGYSCPVCEETATRQALRAIIREHMGADFTEPEVGGSFAVCWQMDALELARFLAAELREAGSYIPPGPSTDLHDPKSDQ